MSFLHQPFNMMYLFIILSALICMQLVTKASSNSAEVADNERLQFLSQLQSAYNNDENSNSNSESAEENDYDRRSTSFLRFGRRIAPSGSFLRFGRSNPTFLRFGRRLNHAGSFLRFGRQIRPSSRNNFLRFGRKAEFLRFG